jgi:hypothetical protein
MRNAKHETRNAKHVVRVWMNRRFDVVNDF